MQTDCDMLSAQSGPCNLSSRWSANKLDPKIGLNVTDLYTEHVFSSMFFQPLFIPLNIQDLPIRNISIFRAIYFQDCSKQKKINRGRSVHSGQTNEAFVLTTVMLIVHLVSLELFPWHLSQIL